jgi:hypothetical protein
MRPEGILAVALTLFSAGCASGSPGHAAAPATGARHAAAFDESAAPMPRYHSKRLAISLPLPGRAWRIDDHSAPYLVATHELTRSTVVVAILRADAIVGRAGCDEMARERRLLPEGPLQVLEDEVTMTREVFDTRVLVSLESGAGPQGPLVGHVTAVGGFLRKCYVFAFTTAVDDVTDEAVLSGRLAVARARILGGLDFDAFATPSRASPSPTPPPSR